MHCWIVWPPLAPRLDTVISHKPDFRLGISEVAAKAVLPVARSVTNKVKYFLGVSGVIGVLF